MKVKLAPFPGTNAERSFLSTAWTQIQGENKGHLLVCGSECGKVFVWRISVGGAEGASLAGQTAAHLTVGTEEEDVGAICFLNECRDKCFVACGSKLVLVELKETATGNGALRVEGEWTFNDDDINCLALSHDDHFLAAADDTGEIKLVQLKPQVKVHRTLRKHTTICSSVLFRPRRPSSILSSGLDSVIVVWEDFTRCRVGQVVKMADVVKVAAANKKEAEGDADPEPPSSYMVNPPLVHCVASSPNGDWLAAGVEDSSVQLFDTSKKTVIFVTSSPSKVHTKGVSQIAFISDDKFISGGNDGLLVVWQVLQTTTTETAETAPTDDSAKKGKRQKSGKNKTTPQKTPQSKVKVETVIRSLTRIQHDEPVNWISVLKVEDENKLENSANSEANGETGAPPSGDDAAKCAPLNVVVAVADSSSDIVLYQIKL